MDRLGAPLTGGPDEPAADGITEPAVLHVQWLEEGLLVHGITVAATGPPLHLVHVLAATAVAGVLSGLALAASGWVWAGSAVGGVGVGCAVGLGRLGWARAHTEPAAPRRLLVEIGRDRVSWTSLAGDRWSMQHEHQAPLADVVRVVPEPTPAGATLRVELRGAEPWVLPVHGLPDGDVRWLADRIREATDDARRAPSASDQNTGGNRSGS